jgi:hypothetical protein
MVVQRRVVAQIVPAMNGETPIIGALHVVGRPDSAHTSTMGDHSTAFAVQLESVVSRMQRQPYPAALGHLDGLINALPNLDGWALIPSAPDGERAAIAAAWNEVTSIRTQIATLLTTDAASPRLVLLLQQYIAAYFDLRELVPLSTINVRVKAPALAGKGKGESGHAAVLHGGRAAVDAGTAADAIAGLFDAASVGLAAAEASELIEVMVPGLTVGSSALEKVQKFVAQHLKSIEVAYPWIWTVGGLAKDAVSAVLVTSAMRHVYRSVEAEIKGLRKMTGTLRRESQRAREGLLLKKNVYDRRRLEAANAKLKPITKAIKELTKLLATLTDYAPDAEELEEETETSTDETDERVLSGTASAQVVAPVAAVAQATVDDADEEDEEVKRQPLGVQVLTAADGTIMSVAFAGRPPSPFGNTMGAHTTAWIVHLDRVRITLVGKTVDQAVVALRDVLVPEAKALKQSRTAHFPIREDHRARLDEAERVLDAWAAPAARVDDTQGLRLQQYIAALLTYENYLPGATLEAADTGGKSEGKHRRILLNHQGAVAKYASSELTSAVKGLLDIKNLSLSQQRVLRADHDRLILSAYPAVSATLNAPVSRKRSARTALEEAPAGKRQEVAPPPPVAATGWAPDFTMFQ